MSWHKEAHAFIGASDIFSLPAKAADVKSVFYLKFTDGCCSQNKIMYNINYLIIWLTQEGQDVFADKQE